MSTGSARMVVLVWCGRVWAVVADWAAGFGCCGTVVVVTRSRGGPGHGTLRWTRTSEQAGKALRSQGHHCACVM